MVVLHELGRQSQGFELVGLEDLHEEAALILENLRSEDTNPI
jgi:hypothetical protein